MPCKLPHRADRITDARARGRLTINLRLFSDPRDVTVITTLVNRVFLALTDSALRGISVILMLAWWVSRRRRSHVV
jgi:ubiquinone biosynthesis protein